MKPIALHPIGPTAYNNLMSELTDSRRRAIRIETRLCKLMVHFGLDEQGFVPHSTPTQTTPTKE